MLQTSSSQDDGDGDDDGNTARRNSSCGNHQQRRKSTYQNVLQKRASILIRRQSVVESSEKEKEKSKENEGGDRSCERSEHDYGLKHIDITTAISIIQLLRERGHDVNAFVRSATLRTLNLLCEEGRIPLSEYVFVTKMALERVKDKAVLVRKNAITVGME